MNTLFNNLINTKNKDLGDPNLKQGERFDFMQNQIMKQNTSKLRLIEQTTGNGLSSIIEPMTGTDLQVELKKLEKIEEVYEQLINKLVTLNKHIDEPSVYSNSAQGQDTSTMDRYFVTKKGAACPEGSSILNDTNKCSGFFNNLKANPKAFHRGERITADNKTFTKAPVNTNANTQLLGKPHGCIMLNEPIRNTDYSCVEDYGKGGGEWYDKRCPNEGQTCMDKTGNWGWCGSTAGATFNTINTDIKKDPNSSLVCVENVKDELFSQISIINMELDIVAGKLVQQIKKLNTLHKKNDQNLNVHRDDFSNSLSGLIQKKKELDALLQGSNNMRGQLQEKRIEMKSSYIEYITWFICAVTIGGVALSKLSR